jgi:mRNA-degrading endonuclease toxin of MazEF toxin-antitoxin module
MSESTPRSGTPRWQNLRARWSTKTAAAAAELAQAEQVRSIDTTRLGAPAGSLPGEVMGQIDEALRLHLAL